MAEPKKGTGKHPGKKYGRRLYTDENPRDTVKIKFCLLYTSPSPRDRTRSRMPSSA